ncbi:MAG: type IVB secretion system protein IcmH/DotU [Betaproteobacteria bacterium]|nr:type IVB secretion system protein IcmH/DotU [Betaproteobacteria bacterium]
MMPGTLSEAPWPDAIARPAAGEPGAGLPGPAPLGDAGAAPGAQVTARGATPRNPLLHAAGALLRALAAIQCAQEAPASGLRALHDRLAQEVLEFSRACDRAGLRHEHMLAARYALCTALDEALSCKPWAGGEQSSVGPWSQYALLQEFHQEGEGGRTVFLLITRLAAQPQDHRDVLELMLHILALGFMGDYRCRADGQQALDQVRRRLLGMLGGDTQALSVAPHAQAAPAAAPPGPWRGVLPWVLPAIALVLWAGFAWSWRGQVLQGSTAVREQLLSLRAEAEAALSRPAPSPSLAPQPEPVSAARADVDPRAWLATPIRAGQLEVAPEADGWRIGLRDARMFSQGSSELEPGVATLLRQVAAMLQAHGGQVLVLGYTDATGPRADPSLNQELSRRRAEAVAARLVHDGVPASRVRAIGRSSADPLGDNATEAGRARNRRVDIVLRGIPGGAP